MLSLLSKALNHVNSTKEQDEPEDVSAAPVKVSVEIASERVETKRERYHGCITHLHEEYGLIDGNICFGYDVVQGSRPQVGQEVDAEMEFEPNGSVKCLRLSCLHTDWDDNQEKSSDQLLKQFEDLKNEGGDFKVKSTASVGKIIEMHDCGGFLSDGIPFHVDELQFKANAGDWVKYWKQTEVRTLVSKAIEIHPLRQQLIPAACVTNFRGVDGVIDFTVSFNRSVCEGKRAPHRGDRVKVVCVESEVHSSNGPLRWRAISVVPVYANSLQAGFDSKFLAERRRFALVSPFFINWNSSINKSICDILISDEYTDFGTMKVGSSKTVPLFLRNTSNANITVTTCCFPSPHNTQFSAVIPSRGLLIHSGESGKIELTCHPSSSGRDRKLMLMSLDNGRHTVHYIQVNVPESRQSTRQNESQQFSQEQCNLMLGQRRLRSNASMKRFSHLPQYIVPSRVRKCIEEDGNLLKVLPVLTEQLNAENYRSRFDALLYLEELQNERDMLRYSIDEIQLEERGDLFAVPVPGLWEGRPSVLQGDSLLLKPHNIDSYHDQTIYEACVHEVHRDEVLVKCHADMHIRWRQEHSFAVQFVLNRSTIRRCHQAVTLAVDWLANNSLFPVHCQASDPCIDVRKIRWFNSELNARQKSAIRRVMENRCRDLPYVVFGPPGTGKTHTLVELVLQLLHLNRNSRVLLSAPSNSACDLLAIRLLESGKVINDDIVRFNGFQRSIDSIPDLVLPISLTGDDMELVLRKRLVIGTCMSVSQLLSSELPPQHFSHVLVDEAGQATEPELLIPILCGVGNSHVSGGLFGSRNAQVVLAGDPHQLGPVLSSNEAKTHGLQRSLLERLMSLPVYERDPVKFVDHGAFNPLIVTKLVENYRSHHSLLQLPNRLFYYGELLARARSALVNSCLGWSELLSQTPLLFYGILGDNMRDGDSPSWFNPAEAVRVTYVLRSLVSDKKLKLDLSDIGVITPYRKQVEKIRSLTEGCGLERVKVGSVEEFQGQERKVIIISTVRSDRSRISSDVRHHLGFVSSPKRFNVALTRAQCLLVIIGNPNVLIMDDNWRQLLLYAVERNSYAGCDLPELS